MFHALASDLESYQVLPDFSDSDMIFIADLIWDYTFAVTFVTFLAIIFYWKICCVPSHYWREDWEVQHRGGQERLIRPEFKAGATKPCESVFRSQ
jgi:hypothetical protein